MRQAEALAHDEGVPVRKPQKARGGKVKDPDTVALEKRVSDALGLAVSVDHRDPGGTVHIRYRDLDQLDEIVRRLDKGLGACIRARARRDSASEPRSDR